MDLVLAVFGGEHLPRGEAIILFILQILAILLQTRERLRSAGPFLLIAPTFYRH